MIMRTTNNAEYYERKQEVKLRRQDLIEPELSYNVLGIAFRVFNDLGPGLYEKNYQQAMAIGLSGKNIKFIQQFPIKLRFLEESARLFWE